MSDSQLEFPRDFLWGAATAAYQIEGAVDQEGRGESIWDRFVQMPGKVAAGATGDIAADHYHRWREDVELMKALNLRAYRFSVSWARIMPDGRGAVNQAGLDFYSQLVDALLEAKIVPFITLYHWDMPQVLQDEGGWLRRGIAADFAAYTDVVARALGDRVKHWITLNEPWVIGWMGYGTGEHAPGLTSETPEAPLRAIHHTLLAHGAAVQALRASVPAAEIGIAHALEHVEPATGKPNDLAAAARHDGYRNRWFLDPLYRRHYPADMLDEWEAYLPPIEAEDMAQISAPIDFLGVNYYSRAVIGDDPARPGLGTRHVRQDGEHTSMGWEVHPEGLYSLLKRLHTDYAPAAIYVTENGAAFNDEIAADGSIHDDRRAIFLHAHFQAASRAINEGVPLQGYFVWSLMDNFEWAFGYRQRFGLYYVDFTTQRRILKDSGKYFAGLIKG